MLVYLICFISSIILIYLGEHTENKAKRIIFIGIALLIPCVLA